MLLDLKILAEKTKVYMRTKIGKDPIQIHHLAFTSLLQPNQSVYIAIHPGTNDTKSAEQLSGAFKWIIILGYGIFHSVLSFKQMGVGN